MIFWRGDPPDRVYLLETGTVELPEPGQTLTGQTLFGKMASLTDAPARTTTAICRDDCRIAAIDGTTFMGLYRQHPD